MSLSRKLALLINSNQTDIKQVVTVLTKYRMLSLLPNIRQSLIQIASTESSRDTVLIESPFPLSEEATQSIKNLVGGHAAHTETAINKDVLAGFKARYKGVLYDGSAERIVRELTKY